MAKRRRTRSGSSTPTGPTGQAPVGAGKALGPQDGGTGPGGIPWPAIFGVVGLVIVVAVVVGFFLRGSGTPTGAAPSASAAPSEALASAGACPTSQPPALGAGETRTVSMGTELGDITIKLEADLSPIATGQVAALAACGYYDGSVFHRVVPKFVIQGGDGEDLGYTIQDEPVTATYERGVVAMARTGAPNSVTTQFFIVLDDQAQGALAAYNTYQIVGHVTAGMEVADAIAAAADAEIPSDPVAMTTVTIANP